MWRTSKSVVSLNAKKNVCTNPLHCEIELVPSQVTLQTKVRKIGSALELLMFKRVYEKIPGRVHLCLEMFHKILSSIHLES